MTSEPAIPRYENTSKLVQIAERQIADSTSRVGRLDQKLSVVIGAQGVVLFKGAELSWFPDRCVLGTLWALFGCGSLVFAAMGLWAKNWSDAPHLKDFWEEHSVKSQEYFSSHLLSTYENAIRANHKQGEKKGRMFNVSLVGVMIAFGLTIIEIMIERM